MSVRDVIAKSGPRVALTRRHFVRGAGAGLLTLAAMPSPACASGREVPILEWLSLRVVTDDAVSIASPIRRLTGLSIEELHGAHDGAGLIHDDGFSLHAQSIRRTEMRNVLFDFGCAREALDSNLRCLRISPAAIDQVVTSQPGRTLARLPLLGSGPDAPALVADHGFAARPVPARGFEAASVEEALTLDPTPVSAACQPQHTDVTVSFLLVCRGLVVVTSCDPRTLMDAIRQAQSASGVDKIHAVVIGAGGRADAAIAQVVSELTQIAPDYVAVAHRDRKALFENANAAMPGRVIRTAAGMRLKFAI